MISIGRAHLVRYNAVMTVELNKDIAEAVTRQDHPLEVRDAAGRVYVVMTHQQFQKYVYDDSELTSDEMLAAAALHLDDRKAGGRLTFRRRSVTDRVDEESLRACSK